MHIRPRLRSGNAQCDRVYDLAIDTLLRNIKPWRDGLLEHEAPAIMAGGNYPTPWTRDCAFNIWNAAALLAPEASRNTLLSTLTKDEHGVRIGGQYWDAIAWVTGAWAYYVVTGDKDFLPLLYEATVNSLAYFERTEFDAATGLFEGPAAYGDGVAAYPEPYCNAGGSPSILDYPAANLGVDKNHMRALSTNALYYNAYRTTTAIGASVGVSCETLTAFTTKADALRRRINERLWLPERKHYAYFLDDANQPDPHQEALGHSFVILFGIADDSKADAILDRQHVCDWGVPCVWPLFPRFALDSDTPIGRHNGTVWPFIQAFWACAAARRGRIDVVDHELQTLTEMTDRHHEFKEIYHPLTGAPFGGWQIDNGSVRLWESEPHQTWSATGHLRIIHEALLGLRFDEIGVTFAPLISERFNELHLGPIAYRDMELNLHILGNGTQIARMLVNGRTNTTHHLPADATGEQDVVIEMQSRHA